MKTITIIASQCNKNNGSLPVQNDKYSGALMPYLSLLVPALTQKNYHVEVVAWDDPVDWDSKECILMGPAWDYSKNVAQFDRLLSKLCEVKAKVMNDPHVMLWNVDKNYLSELIQQGVPVASTEVITDIAQLDSILTNSPIFKSGEFVAIKGVKDAGGISFKKIKLTDTKHIQEHVVELIKNYNGAIIKKYIPEIVTRGELSFAFFGDYYYMFFRIGSKNEERVQVFHGGRSFHFTLETFEAVKKINQAERKPAFDVTLDEIKNAVDSVFSIRKKLPDSMYYRLDGIVTKDAPFLLMEAEMIEP